MTDLFPIPTVLVINLDERNDRWLNILKTCRQCGITPERVSAVKHKPGWVGCAKSHKKCAQIALDRGLPWVLVLEDDCTFSIEEWRRFMALLPFLWSHRDSWNFFNGGLTFAKNIELFDHEHRILKANGMTAHFILYTPSAATIIANWKDSDTVVDVFIDNQLKSITPYPLIASQLPNYSDINEAELDYTSCFNDTNNKFREFLESIGL